MKPVMIRAWRRRLKPALFLTSALIACAVAATPSRIFAADAGYSELSAPYAQHHAAERPLLDVLQRFADDHGLSLSIAGAAARDDDRWRAARVAGRIRGDSGRDFLEQLSNAHHFDWFVANRRLHLSARADATVERIALRGISAGEAKAALAAIGLYDDRFGWGALDGSDAVLVAGPREYVSLVRRYLSAGTPPAKTALRAQPMIFPLRYAQAADGAPFDGNGIARPGVASIMRQLLAHGGESRAPTFVLPTGSTVGTDLPTASGAKPHISDAGLADWLGIARPATPLSSPPPLPPSAQSPEWGVAPAAAAFSSGSRASGIVIVGDERTNTVFVWGDTALRPSIERVVNALDRPMPMVSMEVLVLEADEATVRALAAAPAAPAANAETASSFEATLAQAIDQARAKVLNRQALTGFANLHVTLAIGAEESHLPGPRNPGTGAQTADDNANGRAGNSGDALDLVARLLPAQRPGHVAIAVDAGVLMAQPTGLPGQAWGSTTSVKLRTAVALEGGAAPRLVATYPVATSRERQRAIFLRADALQH
jgi:hypothetical protein